MTDFFEIFSPGLTHWREKQDLDKTLVIELPSGDPEHSGSTIDLDRGTATIVAPTAAARGHRPRRTRPDRGR